MKTIQQLPCIVVKVWFAGSNISRTFSRVTSITREGTTLTIENNSGTTYLLNWDNINLIEEIHE